MIKPWAIDGLCCHEKAHETSTSNIWKIWYVFLFMRKMQGNFLMVFELVFNKCKTPSSVTDQKGKGRKIWRSTESFFFSFWWIRKVAAVYWDFAKLEGYRFDWCLGLALNEYTRCMPGSPEVAAPSVSDMSLS